MRKTELEGYWEMFTDAWRFFQRILKLDGSDRSWEEVIRLGNECVERHHGSRLCKDLVLAIVDEFERRMQHGSREEIK